MVVKFKTYNTVSNKNTHIADFETCVFREYFWNLDSVLGLAPIILLWKPEGSLKVVTDTDCRSTKKNG